jgi:glycosyltransferase involved in cell wall biosynthesis
VIPAYNCRRFIARAVASVRAQTRPVDEIVVVDDGSTDDTAAVVASLGGDIRLLKQANAGPGAARNRGVRSARSELIAFLDADDEWFPGAVAELAAAAEAYPDVGLVSADCAEIDENGTELSASWYAKHGVTSRIAAARARPMENALAQLARCNFINTNLALVRSEVVMRAGGFREDIRYGEDLELWLRMAMHGSVIVLPRVLGHRRTHGSNVTKSIEPMLKDLVRMNEIVRDWGRDVLREQGLDADEVVARARTDLGYWYFNAGRMQEARKALGAALGDHFSSRALRYFLLSCLPTRAIQGLRRVRETLDG